MVFLHAGMKRLRGIDANFIRLRLDPLAESALATTLVIPANGGIQ
jgi:hypothetical protein